MQQHPDNSVRKIHSEKRKGLIGSIIFHSILLLLLIFIAFKIPPPPDFEEGIEVNFGTDETGFGLIEPAPLASAAASVPASAPRPISSTDVPLLTQDIEEAPEVRRVDPDAERRRVEAAAEAERIRRENLEAERIRRDQEAERQRIAADQQRQAEIADRTRNAFAGGGNAGSTSTSDGTAGGTGNHGVPTGSPDSNIRGDGGSGTGNSGTGAGSGGNRASYDLGGRGHVGSLPLPISDYQERAIVIVEVRVDSNGRVTQVSGGRPGSTTLNPTLVRAAEEAARATRFTSDPNQLIQVGTITYNFILR